MKTDNPDEIEYAKTHAQIIQTYAGGYGLMIPTRLNKKLKPFVGKDFEMHIVKDEQTLSVILTEKK
jgi:hypothetical protein